MNKKFKNPPNSSITKKQDKHQNYQDKHHKCVSERERRERGGERERNAF